MVFNKQCSHMPLHKSRLFHLIQLLRNDQLSKLERRELLELLADEQNLEEAQILLEVLWHENNFDVPFFSEQASDALFEKLALNNPQHEVVKRFPIWKPLLVAAAILIAFFSFVIFSNHSTQKEVINIVHKQSSKSVEKKEKSTKSTILTLSDGSEIDLDKQSAGDVLKADGISIYKSKDGQIVYSVDQQASNSLSTDASKKINTISTGKGKQYLINLPDGSKVWLNSESTLKFPLAFAQNERKVEMVGEGYFEINPQYFKGKKTPFKVTSNGASKRQEINVLGTHFNVKVYENDVDALTTLIEGKVEIVNLNTNKTNVLLPGEQAKFGPSGDKVKRVDLESVLAWKNGTFIFNNQTLYDTMKELERWYDITVDYNQIPETRFYGSIDKTASLNEVLEMLEITGDLKFTVVDRPGTTEKRIIINNNKF